MDKRYNKFKPKEGTTYSYGTMNKQDNPGIRYETVGLGLTDADRQDNVPQVKTVEVESKLKCMDCCHEFPYHKLVTVKRKQQCPSCGSVHYDFIDQEFKKKGMQEITIAILKSRIAELEAEKTRLQSGIKDFISTVDRLKKEYIPLITALEAERDKYREALEKIVKRDYSSLKRTYMITSDNLTAIAEQALNSKEVGNG